MPAFEQFLVGITVLFDVWRSLCRLRHDKSELPVFTGRGILIYFEVGLHSSMHNLPGWEQGLIGLIPEINGLQGVLQTIAVQLTDNAL